jgi:hypothetical protein
MYGSGAPRQPSCVNLLIARYIGVGALLDRNVHFPQQCLKALPVKMNITPVPAAGPDFVIFPTEAPWLAKIKVVNILVSVRGIIAIF